MSEVKWHRDAAVAVANALFGPRAKEFDVVRISENIALNDPTGPALEAAEKALKECVGMLRAYVGEVPLTDDDWTEEHGIMAQADAALAAIREARR